LAEREERAGCHGQAAIRAGCAKVAKASGSFDDCRYWLDSNRDSIVVRFGYAIGDRPGKERPVELDTGEEPPRPRRGVFFASNFRRNTAVGRDEGKTSE
jgi:hypothetical protein